MLHPMCTQVILRMGHWLHQAMYTHYLAFFKTEGLLAMGGWPHAQAKDFTHFWHERFEMDIPASMLSLVRICCNDKQWGVTTHRNNSSICQPDHNHSSAHRHTNVFTTNNLHIPWSAFVMCVW